MSSVPAGIVLESMVKQRAIEIGRNMDKHLFYAST
ncbi:MAG: hypothetical protein JWM87_1459 [Candidatus Eremiobacteraeota bacterium]|nr:hypothetical protein [Candidatus Eremiobacteraeota bacterium]